MKLFRSRECKHNLLTYVEIGLFLVGLLLIQTCVSQDTTLTDSSNSNTGTGTDKKPDSTEDGASKLADASSGNTNLNTDSSVTDSTSDTNTNTDTNTQNSGTDANTSSDQTTLKESSTGTSSGTSSDNKVETPSTPTNDAAGSTDQTSETQTNTNTQNNGTDVSVSSKDAALNETLSSNVAAGTDTGNVDPPPSGEVKVGDASGTSSSSGTSDTTNSQTDISSGTGTGDTGSTQSGSDFPPPPPPFFPPPPPPPPPSFNQNQGPTSTDTKDPVSDGSTNIETSVDGQPKDSSLVTDNNPQPPPPPEGQGSDITTQDQNTGGSQNNVNNDAPQPPPEIPETNSNNDMPPPPPDASSFPPPPPTFENTNLNETGLTGTSEPNSANDNQLKTIQSNTTESVTSNTTQNKTNIEIPQPPEAPQNNDIQPPENPVDNQSPGETKTLSTNTTTNSSTVSVSSEFPPPPPSFGSSDSSNSDQESGSTANTDNNVNIPGSDLPVVEPAVNTSLSSSSIQSSNMNSSNNASTTSTVGDSSLSLSADAQGMPPPPPGLDSSGPDGPATIDDIPPPPPPPPPPRIGASIITKEPSPINIPMVPPPPPSVSGNEFPDLPIVPPPPPPSVSGNEFPDLPIVPPPPPPPPSADGKVDTSLPGNEFPDLPIVPPPPPPPADGKIDSSLSGNEFPDLPIVPPPPPRSSSLPAGSANLGSDTNSVGNSSLSSLSNVDGIRTQNNDASVPQELRNIINIADKNEKSPVTTSKIGSANQTDPPPMFPPPRPDLFEMGPLPPPPPPPAPPSFELTGVSTTPEPISTIAPAKQKVKPVNEETVPPPPPPSEALAPKPRYVEKPPEIVVTLTHPSFKPIQPPTHPLGLPNQANNQKTDYSIQDLFRLRQPGMPSPFMNTNWNKPTTDTPTQEERLQNILFSNQNNNVPHPLSVQNQQNTNNNLKTGVFTRPSEKPDPLLSLLQPGMPLPSLAPNWQQSNENDQKMSQRLADILFGNRNNETPHPLGEPKQGGNVGNTFNPNSFTNTIVGNDPRIGFQRQDLINRSPSTQLPNKRFEEYNINHSQIKNTQPTNRFNTNTSPSFPSGPNVQVKTSKERNSVGSFNPLDPNYLFGNTHEKEFYDYWTNKAFMGNPVPENSQKTRQQAFTNPKQDLTQRITSETRPNALNDVLHNRQNVNSRQSGSMTDFDVFRNRHQGNSQQAPILWQPQGPGLANQHDSNTNGNKDPTFHWPNQNTNDNSVSANQWDVSRFTSENFHDKKFQNFRVGPVTVTATDSFGKQTQDRQGVIQGSSSEQVNKFQTGLRDNPFLFSHQNNFNTHTTVNPQQIDRQSFRNPSNDINFLRTQLRTTEKPNSNQHFNPDDWWTDPLVSNTWQNTRSNDGILFMPGTAAYKSQPPVEMKDVGAPKIPQFMAHLLPLQSVTTSNDQGISPLVKPKTITPPTIVTSPVQDSFQTGSKSFTPHPLISNTDNSGSNPNFLSKNQDVFGSKATISSQPIDTPENQKNWEKLVFSMITPNNKNNWESNNQNSNLESSIWDSNTGQSNLYITQTNNNPNIQGNQWNSNSHQNNNLNTQDNQWNSNSHQTNRIQQQGSSGLNTQQQNSWNEYIQQNNWNSNSNRQPVDTANFGGRGTNFNSKPKPTKSWSELLNSAVDSQAPETSAYGWPELLHIKNNHAIDAAVGKEFSSIPKEAPPPVPTDMKEPVMDLSKVVGSTLPPVTAPMTIEIRTIPGLVTDTENGIIFKPKTNEKQTNTIRPPVTKEPPKVIVTPKPVVSGTTKVPDIPSNEILRRPPMPGENTTLPEPRTLDNVEHMKELLFPLEICKKCVYINDYCYLQDNETCNRFVMCFQQGTIIRAFQKECAFGQFWNFTAISCQAASRVDCPLDPCKNFSVRSYAYEGKCKAYWTCRRGRSDARCCPKGYAYNSKGRRAGCRPDNKCKTECSPAPIEVKNPACPLHASSSKFHFLEAGIRKPCAPGTMFNLTACTCVMAKETPPPQPAPVCDASLSLDFNGNSKETAFRDRSNKRQTFAIYHVYPKANTAMFYGDGRITLWRYSNLNMGSQFALRLRFYAHGGRQRPQVLLANCEGAGGYQDSTVEIRLNSITHEITFKLSTLERPNNVILMTYKPFRWYDLVYVYDGDMFAAGLDGKIETVFVHGLIKNRHSSIVIGGCQNRDGFKGYLDDIRFYDGCIPDDIEAMI